MRDALKQGHNKDLTTYLNRARAIKEELPAEESASVIYKVITSLLDKGAANNARVFISQYSSIGNRIDFE